MVCVLRRVDLMMRLCAFCDGHVRVALDVQPHVPYSSQAALERLARDGHLAVQDESAKCSFRANNR